MEPMQLLDLLPQKTVIEQDDAARWLTGVMRWFPERADWHIRRLTGIGGSEMGAVLRGLLDVPGATGFSTIQHVVESKLMKRLPIGETAHMKRGNTLEHLARLAFLYRYKASQDTNALNALSQAKPRNGYEWCVGNPDDFNIVQGRRFLNDYKVPSTYTEDIEFDYSAQLHHYGLMARFADIKVDGLLLTKLDIAPELAASLVIKVPGMSDAELHELAKSIASIDVPGFRVVSHAVDFQRDMQLDILDCGHHCWHDMVVMGVVPNSQQSLIELDEPKLLEVAQYQYQYAMAKSGIAHLTKIAEHAESQMVSALDGVEFADKELPLGLVKVSPKGFDKEALITSAFELGATEDELRSGDKTYSVVALIDEIKRLNGDPEATHLFTAALDPAKASAYLTSKGADLESLRKPGIALRMSTKKQDKETGAMMQRSAAEIFDRWFEDNTVTPEENDGMDVIEQPYESVTGTLHEAFVGADADHENHEKTQSPMKSAGLR